MTVSIHQPNFFPWLGYFHKINQSDAFIFLTQAQRTNSDNYFTRTKIRLNGDEKYLSIPFGKQEPKICELKMPDDKKWIQKHLNLIYSAYKKAPYFEKYFQDIEKLYKQDEEHYYQYSINIIKYFIKYLNIDTKIYVDLDFNKDFGTSNERNINLCKEISADIYLSGTGAKVYNDIELFKKNNLELEYQQFNIEKYNLSILDILFQEDHIEKFIN